MKQNKEVIGLTGTIAAGKSTAARYFTEQYGIPVIDADIVGHEVLKDPVIIQQLAEAISPSIVVDGAIDRKILGGIVFQNPEMLQVLNGITHPAITAKIDLEIQRFMEQENTAPVLLIEAYGLYQSDLIHRVSKVWAVWADRELRIRRVMERQGLSREEAERRVHNQWPDAVYIEKADAALDGSYDAQYLKKQCDCLMEKYKQ